MQCISPKERQKRLSDIKKLFNYVNSTKYTVGGGKEDQTCDTVDIPSRIFDVAYGRGNSGLNDEQMNMIDKAYISVSTLYGRKESTNENTRALFSDFVQNIYIYLKENQSNNKIMHNERDLEGGARTNKGNKVNDSSTATTHVATVSSSQGSLSDERNSHDKTQEEKDDALIVRSKQGNAMTTSSSSWNGYTFSLVEGTMLIASTAARQVIVEPATSLVFFILGKVVTVIVASIAQAGMNVAQIGTMYSYNKITENTKVEESVKDSNDWRYNLDEEEENLIETMENSNMFHVAIRTLSWIAEDKYSAFKAALRIGYCLLALYFLVEQLYGYYVGAYDSLVVEKSAIKSAQNIINSLSDLSLSKIHEMVINTLPPYYKHCAPGYSTAGKIYNLLREGALYETENCLRLQMMADKSKVKINVDSINFLWDQGVIQPWLAVSSGAILDAFTPKRYNAEKEKLQGGARSRRRRKSKMWKKKTRKNHKKKTRKAGKRKGKKKTRAAKKR